jgi:C1A family cysteine protease
MTRHFGCIRDPPHQHKVLPSIEDSLPSSVNLLSKCPPVYDQGQLGSCTANSVAGAVQFVQPHLTPSRLFIYYNTRVIEHDVPIAAGTSIYDAIKAVGTNGVCSENEWPYIISKFANLPSKKCYEDASKDVIRDYWSIAPTSTSTQVLANKQCLAKGHPIVFGLTIFESFDSDAVAATGNVPMPIKGEKNIGGHSMLIIGYNDATQRFLVRNSWGVNWGDKGMCTIPYEYITNYCWNFWSIF